MVVRPGKDALAGSGSGAGSAHHPRQPASQPARLSAWTGSKGAHSGTHWGSTPTCKQARQSRTVFLDTLTFQCLAASSLFPCPAPAQDEWGGLHHVFFLLAQTDPGIQSVHLQKRLMSVHLMAPSHRALGEEVLGTCEWGGCCPSPVFPVRQQWAPGSCLWTVTTATTC